MRCNPLGKAYVFNRSHIPTIPHELFQNLFRTPQVRSQLKLYRLHNVIEFCVITFTDDLKATVPHFLKQRWNNVIFYITKNFREFYYKALWTLIAQGTIQMKSDMGRLLTLIIFSESLPPLNCRLLNVPFIYGLGITQSIQQYDTGWTAGVRLPVGAMIFLFSTASKPALGSIKLPLQWVPRALSPGGKAVAASCWPLTPI
jgi:hypothetical protein